MEKKIERNLRVTSSWYDITGQEMTRMGKHYLISKLSRYEALGGGPGLKNIMIMFIGRYLIKIFPGIETSRLITFSKKIFIKLS